MYPNSEDCPDITLTQCPCRGHGAAGCHEGYKDKKTQPLCLQRVAKGGMVGREKYENKATPKQNKKSTLRRMLARHWGVQKKCMSPSCSSNHGELEIKLGLEGWKKLFLKYV